MQLSVALDLNRRGAALDLVAPDKNLSKVAALEGMTVVNPLDDANPSICFQFTGSLSSAMNVIAQISSTQLPSAATKSTRRRCAAKF